jgi:hypothetical protein
VATVYAWPRWLCPSAPPRPTHAENIEQTNALRGRLQARGLIEEWFSCSHWGLFKRVPADALKRADP